ncbi:MAG: 3-phosphoshikimate 1-carboxyvinyltransferase [Spirochaetia bacterium]|nr:3-phosphoshikimate 1-carboxyvinyltransferase [Spirochaetota bacterium]MDW8112806.1 3-phosphoshikimate 1-carboxyvinyltransferase [Spirochaetia bacterium]
MLSFKGNDVRISSVDHYIDKSLTVPGSKSITNRVLLVSALNSNRVKLKNVLISDDTTHMLNSLQLLGFKVIKEVYSKNMDYPEIRDFIDFIQSRCVDSLVVEIGGGAEFETGDVKSLFTGNSGTTMRFLCSFLPLLKGEFVLDGDARMRERPISDLTKALRQLGIQIEDNNGFPPVRILSNGIVYGGEVNISGRISSQYISSIMMSAPYYRQGVKINIVDELVSKPFVDMTSSLMSQFGVKVSNQEYRLISIPRGEYSRSADFFVEPDLTNAFYFLSIPAIIPSRITIFGIGRNTIQGDIKFLDILKEIGCEVVISDRFITVEGSGNPRGIDVDMNDIPDLVQTLAVISLFANRPTSIRNVANLRVKETDRISALCNEIRKLGAGVEEYEDGIKVIPRTSYSPVSISTYNDHRMAMSFALAGLRIDGLVIENYRCTSKTFPSFWDYFEFIYTKHLY